MLRFFYNFFIGKSLVLSCANFSSECINEVSEEGSKLVTFCSNTFSNGCDAFLVICSPVNKVSK
jgi:hypothetical protein